MSRLMAIQILYQYHFFNYEKDLEEIKQDVIENYAISSTEDITSYRDQIDEDFLNNLLSSITLEIENEISPLLKDGFTLKKLDSVLYQILHLATFELKLIKGVPFKVIIDEYVDIAASFFDKKTVTFVNAILENLAKKFREKEFKKSKQDD